MIWYWGKKIVEKCFLCEKDCTDFTRQASYNRTFYDCENCGRYYVYGSAKSTALENKHILAGYLYETNRKNSENKYIEPFEVTIYSIPEILTSEKVPKTTMQKLEKLLLYFYKQNEYIGQEHKVDTESSISTAYAKNYDEFISMVYSLNDMGWLDDFNPVETDNTVLMAMFRISVEGLTCAEQLLTTNTDSTKVFVALGFMPDLLDACEKAIKPACQSCGFDAFLISDKEHNKGITDEIIVAIKTSKFVITDFTYNNCGAYFEAGYAQGLSLEIIRLCKKEWFDEKDENGNNINQLHFDIRHYNLILWENHDDLIKRLKARIRATVSDAKMED